MYDNFDVMRGFVMKENDKYISVDGEKSYEIKPEDLTQLKDNILIEKNSPQIKYRGMLDLCEAIVIEIQYYCNEAKNEVLLKDLESVLSVLCKLMSCDVLCTELGEYRIANLNPDEIRDISHNPVKHFGVNHCMPSYKNGLLGCKLNYLRTVIRQTELCAIDAYTKKDEKEQEYIKALNRLSSAVYVLYLREVTGYYNNKN